MIKIRLIARKKDDISIAAIDFFSFGHLLVGYLSLLILFSIFFVNYGISTLFFYLVGNLIISVIWELIENFWLYEVNIKFAHRRDSIINSITDIKNHISVLDKNRK